jgi:hypothetical protein
MVRTSFAVILIAVPGLFAQSDQPTAAQMTTAAQSFLETLTPELRAKTSFAFDDPYRTVWAFTPQQDKDKKPTRQGVRREELSRTQEAAAFALLQSGLSKDGFEQARAIMENEGHLHQHEHPHGTNVRSPGWYFFTVFGTPGPTGTWGWRLEGHHLCVSYTLSSGKIVGMSPVLFGMNPAEYKDGPDKGKRVLANVEDLANSFIASLSTEHNTVARQAKQFPEIKEKQAHADVGEPIGLAAAKLDRTAKVKLTDLVNTYAKRFPADLAAVEAKRLQDGGIDKLHFAYCRDDAKPGKPWSYRIYGDGFVIEFLNVQADVQKHPANHIHSAWRRIPKDF